MKRYLLTCFSAAIVYTSVCSVAIAQQKVAPAFNHLALFVTDLKASAAFYKDVVGLDTIAEPFKDGKHAWFKIGVNASLHVIEGAAKKSEYNRNAHLCLSVSSVPEFIEVLQKNGIAFEDKDGKVNAVTRRVDGVYQIYFKDPDNYWIEINDAKS